MVLSSVITSFVFLLGRRCRVMQKSIRGGFVTTLSWKHPLTFLLVDCSYTHRQLALPYLIGRSLLGIDLLADHSFLGVLVSLELNDEVMLVVPNIVGDSL